MEKVEYQLSMKAGRDLRHMDRVAGGAMQACPTEDSLSLLLIAIIIVPPAPPSVLSEFLFGLLTERQQSSGAELRGIFCCPGARRWRPPRWISM